MNEFLLSAFGWILTASMKGALLALIVAAILWLTRDRIPASWRYVLWGIVFLRLAIPVAPQSAFSVFNLFDLSPLPARTLDIQEVLPGLSAEHAGAIVMPAEHAALRWRKSNPLAMWAAAVWSAGFVLLALRMLVASARLHWRLRRDLQGAAPRRIGPLRILETDLVSTPALHGILKPVLLLPRGFFATFEQDEQRFIFLHELAHHRRFDVIANWAIALIQIVHWFNPLAWLAAMRIREERELACDESALHCLQQEERPRYGRTVLKLLEVFRTAAPVPALLGILNGKQQMKRRILMISRYRTKPRTTLLFLALCLGLATVALTDAPAGEKRRFVKFLGFDHAVFGKLDQKMTFSLTNVTLGEVLTAISTRTGVAISQAPEVLAAEAQQKRVSIDADQIPARAILIETVTALDLGFEVKDEAVVVVTDRPTKRMRVLHKSEDGDVIVEKKVIRSDKPGEIDEEFEIEELEKELPEGANRKVFIRKINDVNHKISPDGTVRRTMTIKSLHNGVESTGKLTLEVKPN